MCLIYLDVMSQQNFHKNHFFVFHLFEFDVFI